MGILFSNVQGLSAWINTYLARASIPPITTLPDDITDGVRLLQFLELVTEKPVGPFKKEPTNRIQNIENCSKAIKFISNDLQIRLVGIGAEGSPPCSPSLPKQHLQSPTLIGGFFLSQR